MARRATILERYRHETVPTLTLVGAEEFAPDTRIPDAAKTGNASPAVVRAVYDALQVDCGMLSSSAAAWFGPKRPRNFFESGTKPVVRRFTPGGIPVAVVLFPPLSVGGTSESEAPTKKLLAQVLAAADSVPDAVLRIGISPWGFDGEYAAGEALESRYQILLGGGAGAALAGEISRQGGLVWSRSDRDGRSIMVLDILSVPQPGQPVAWELGLSVDAREVRLTSSVPSDPRIAALLP